jgi:hypothetical protein
MNTFKFNTEDTAGEHNFPYPKELREEDRFLAELLTELAPCVRAMQASEGGEISEERRVEILSRVKKIFEPEKK